MGAMAPPPHWIPEDDVLLKNAVEAGASLESLAKGAVQFSRRYTVQELRHRWSSLLYDPVVSKEASADMVEVERFGVINQLRPNKLEGVKDITCSSGKRKAESVRKYYYAMRKRICNEPLDMIGLDLVSEPGYPSFRDVNEFSYCRIDNSDNLGARGPDCIIRPHYFPKFGPHAAESTENDATPLLSGVQNHGQEDLCGENVPNSLPFPYEENISLTGDCSEIRGFVQSKDLPMCDLFEADDLVNEAGACSEFVDQSFHSFGCPRPLTEMPIWHTSQEISTEVLPIETADADLHLTDEFMLPEARNEPDALGDMTSSTQEYLEVLFDLSDDEGLLYMDNDGNEAIEKSYLDGLSSLLLDSPNQCELSGYGLGEPVVAADRHVVDRQEVADAQVSAFGSTMKVGPEYRYGVICCILNTEDPEIPSNDDVFLPFRFPSPTNSSGPHWTMHSSSYLGSSSVKNFSSTRTANGGTLGMKNTQKGLCVPSGRMGLFHPSDARARYRREHGDKFELPESSVQHAALREARRSENPNHVSLANVNANNIITGAAKGGPMEMGQGKNIGITSRGPCLDKKETSLDTHQSLQKNNIGDRNGVDGLAEIPCNRLSNYDPSFKQTGVLKATDQSLLSDHEELLYENEFDMPYFSDVEAMILDMDLSPDEFDLYTNPEVQRYQLEETKRTIIRLEQAADAFTQRAVHGQGAFAILYGRCSRHFIRKTEVLLGRETDDIKVDIDLGREKNGGKISRRQATIKMDMNGMFHLKNLGKTSIYMNGKEVAPGHSLGLTSGCLIEVRGLAFVFETNRKMIKPYVDGYTEDELLADHKPLARS